MKKVYSTGEVAKICNVSLQTIIRCFDSGLIRGFRVPGSRFRKVPHEELVQFMERSGITTTYFEPKAPRLLVVTEDECILSVVSNAFGNGHSHELRVARDAFDAGTSLHERFPDYVIVDATMPGIELSKFASAIRPNGHQLANGVLAIDPPPHIPEPLKIPGITACLMRPFSCDELRSAIRDCL